MDYKINVDVHKWKKDQMVSESELLSEGIIISKWLNDGLIKKPEVPKLVGDLNNDGVVDNKDGNIASSVLNILKSTKKKTKGG